MRWSWLNHPQRQLALTAVVPTAMVGLLWWLANQTWSRTERTRVPPAPDNPRDTPLADRSMFNGRGPVRKLRAVHVAAGFTVVAAMLLLPLWHRPHTSFADAFWRGGLLGLLTLVVLAGLVLVVALAFLPSMTDRDTPRGDPPTESDGYKFLPWLALALVVGVGAFVWFSPAFDEAWPGSVTSGGLPGYADAVVWLFAVQAVLLLGSAALCGWQRSERSTAWVGFA